MPSTPNFYSQRRAASLFYSKKQYDSIAVTRCKSLHHLLRHRSDPRLGQRSLCPDTSLYHIHWHAKRSEDQQRLEPADCLHLVILFHRRFMLRLCLILVLRSHYVTHLSFPYLICTTGPFVSVYRTYLGSCPHLGAVFNIPEYCYIGNGI